MKLKVVFSIDPTGLAQDITEIITVDDGTCLYCSHDDDNRLHNVVRETLTKKGHDLRYYFSLFNVHSVSDVEDNGRSELLKAFAEHYNSQHYEIIDDKFIDDYLQNFH